MILEAFIKNENKTKNYINLDLEQKQLQWKKIKLINSKTIKKLKKINMNIYILKKGKIKLRRKKEGDLINNNNNDFLIIVLNNQKYLIIFNYSSLQNSEIISLFLIPFSSIVLNLNIPLTLTLKNVS